MRGWSYFTTSVVKDKRKQTTTHPIIVHGVYSIGTTGKRWGVICEQRGHIYHNIVTTRGLEAIDLALQPGPAPSAEAAK